MADKKVVLMNEKIYGHKVQKYSICTWSNEQQKKFVQSLYDFKDPGDDECLCNFDVEYDNTCLCDVGLDDGIGCVDNNFPTELKIGRQDEFAIIMKPFMLHDTAPEESCKCGIKDNHQCPKYIKDGKCTAPSIIKLVGKVLFPDKYGKQK